MLWPGSWYMFFRFTSQAYIILVSLLYLFLFFNHSFMVFVSFFDYFNYHTLTTSYGSQWFGCQAACAYIHIMVGVKINE